ncbi:MAG: AI-2E family transporter, partial [Bacteroidales bacterium]|nr:AI-2E family transporter [Bacteroidales bacterium]
MEEIAARKKYDLDRVVRTTFTILAIVAAIYVVNYLSSILLPFCVGCLLAYMLEPVVKLLMRLTRLKKRTVPAIVTMLLFFGVIYLGLRFLIPYFVDEFTDMGKMLAKYAEHRFTIHGVPPEVQEVIDRYFNLDALQRVFSQEQWMKIGKSVMSGTWSVLGGTLSAIATLVSWLLALLYMFFVMIDYDKIGHGFKSAVPPRYRRRVFRIMSDVTGTMSRYFRGQALVSFFVGIVFAIEFY